MLFFLASVCICSLTISLGKDIVLAKCLCRRINCSVQKHLTQFLEFLMTTGVLNMMTVNMSFARKLNPLCKFRPKMMMMSAGAGRVVFQWDPESQPRQKVRSLQVVDLVWPRYIWPGDWHTVGSQSRFLGRSIPFWRKQVIEFCHLKPGTKPILYLVVNGL